VWEWPSGKRRQDACSYIGSAKETVIDDVVLMRSQVRYDVFVTHGGLSVPRALQTVGTPYTQCDYSLHKLDTDIDNDSILRHEFATEIR